MPHGGAKRHAADSSATTDSYQQTWRRRRIRSGYERMCISRRSRVSPAIAACIRAAIRAPYAAREHCGRSRPGQPASAGYRQQRWPRDQSRQHCWFGTTSATCLGAKLTPPFVADPAASRRLAVRSTRSSLGSDRLGRAPSAAAPSPEREAGFDRRECPLSRWSAC
jgi:hypothetical protein